MLSEKDFENIICKYPDLIETDLVLKGRQVVLYGKRMDLLFQDKFGQKLIVELKVGAIERKHIGQIMEYEGGMLSDDDPTIRIMLAGNRVPPNLRKALDHHGIEWKEISYSMLKSFLKEKKDNFYNDKLDINELSKSDDEDSKSGTTDKEEYTVEHYLRNIRDPLLLQKVNELRNKIKSIDPCVIEYCRKHWIQFKSKIVFCGIDTYGDHVVIFVNLPREQVNDEDKRFLDVRPLRDTHYIKVKLTPAEDINLIMPLILRAFQRSRGIGTCDLKDEDIFEDTRSGKRVWMFQGNPKRWRIFDSFKDPEFQSEQSWEVNQYKNEIKKGDLALIWVAGKDAGIYAIADIVSDPRIMGDIPNGKYWINQADANQQNLKVFVKIKQKLYDSPILRSELREIPELRQLKILNFSQGTNFPVTQREWAVIENIIKQRNS